MVFLTAVMHTLLFSTYQLSEHSKERLIFGATILDQLIAAKNLFAIIIYIKLGLKN